jgi:hypothetical protein
MIANATPARELTCITPGCVAHQQTRGVCVTCYQAAKRLMQTGKATDEQLVGLGLLLPHKQRASAGRFFAEYAKRLMESSTKSTKRKVRK